MSLEEGKNEKDLHRERNETQAWIHQQREKNELDKGGKKKRGSAPWRMNHLKEEEKKKRAERSAFIKKKNREEEVCLYKLFTKTDTCLW